VIPGRGGVAREIENVGEVIAGIEGDGAEGSQTEEIITIPLR